MRSMRGASGPATASVGEEVGAADDRPHSRRIDRADPSSGTAQMSRTGDADTPVALAHAPHLVADDREVPVAIRRRDGRERRDRDRGDVGARSNRYSRWSLNSANTSTPSPVTVHAPPPYSWTGSARSTVRAGRRRHRRRRRAAGSRCVPPRWGAVPTTTPARRRTDHRPPVSAGSQVGGADRRDPGSVGSSCGCGRRHVHNPSHERASTT